jgi:hypothetical protein
LISTTRPWLGQPQLSPAWHLRPWLLHPHSRLPTLASDYGRGVLDRRLPPSSFSLVSLSVELPI